ncbi:hypothetical protein BX616_002657 [Lobosporangium transversale]|nr:hypothetical protein BX616_002657 [Lobosporangium transversale]
MKLDVIFDWNGSGNRGDDGSDPLDRAYGDVMEALLAFLDEKVSDVFGVATLLVGVTAVSVAAVIAAVVVVVAADGDDDGDGDENNVDLSPEESARRHLNLEGVRKFLRGPYEE